MKNLSMRSIGRTIFPYILRHSRATELYHLAKQNKISKDVAIMFMGHGEDMSEIYTHLDKNQVREMMSKQVYKLEEDLPPNQKNKLLLMIEQLKSNEKTYIEALTKINERLKNLEINLDKFAG